MQRTQSFLTPRVGPLLVSFKFGQLFAESQQAIRANAVGKVAINEKSRAKVSNPRQVELRHGELPQMTVSNLAAVRRALEGAGIEFIFKDDGAVGVCLRKKLPPIK